MIRKLLGKYYEPYRIRHGWGLSPIRNKRELRALIAFIKEQLLDKEFMELNRNLHKVYSNTITLYEERTTSLACNCPCDNIYYALHDYIDDHVGYYWS